MDVDKITFSAPGKIIIFGEHAVVYGYPAIAAAIDLRARCSISTTSRRINYISTPDLFPNEAFHLNRNVPPSLKALEYLVNYIVEERDFQKGIEIQITSKIPPSAGLGSSAAVMVSLAASLYYLTDKNLDLQRVNDAAFEAEKIIHSTPSGIDNTISTFGGGIRYEEGKMKKLPIKMDTSSLIVINSLIPRNTRDLVNKVKEKYNSNEQKFKTIFEEIQNITDEGEKELAQGNIEKIGYLMTKNHELLNEIGVSHPRLEQIVKKLNQYGSLGSKLTGAGGGGCIISVFDDQENAKQAINKFTDQGLEVFISNISISGVKIE
jgi:mevalonate kinase